MTPRPPSLLDAAAAGAVICGAYFGDKMTPLSETTILVPKLVAILGSALSAGVLACSTQWDAVKRFVDEPGLGPVATGITRSTTRWRTASSARAACR
jgi:hypothetical protein